MAPCLDDPLRNALRCEDDLLHLHLVEEIVALDSLAQRHYLVKHETSDTQSSLLRSVMGEMAAGLPEQMLFLCQKSQCFWEYGSHRTSSHLQLQILAVVHVRYQNHTGG